MPRPLTEEEQDSLNEFDGYALVAAIEALDDIRAWVEDTKTDDLPTLRDQLVRLHEHVFKITIGREDYQPRAESIAFLLREIQTAIGGINKRVEDIGATLASLEEILPEAERTALEEVH